MLLEPSSLTAPWQTFLHLGYSMVSKISQMFYSNPSGTDSKFWKVHMDGMNYCLIEVNEHHYSVLLTGTMNYVSTGH